MANHPNRNRNRKSPEYLIRKHYKDQGYELEISRDGHVQFREPGGVWLEGRWVSEYRIIGENVVLK